MSLYSTNDLAERVMGRRAEGMPLDMPCELGYWCPLCRNHGSEALEWSEYNGFLWCAVCNVDYPSALCIDLTADPDPDHPWVHAGVQSAIETFLATVQQANSREVEPA